jgi:hypothetical protein
LEFHQHQHVLAELSTAFTRLWRHKLTLFLLEGLEGLARVASLLSLHCLLEDEAGSSILFSRIDVFWLCLQFLLLWLWLEFEALVEGDALQFNLLSRSRCQFL